MNAIELKNITKIFGKYKAVDSLTLGVPKGSVYGFIGPNGSGKTTTLRMIMNILYPDSGEILVFGEPLKTATCDNIGYMPEERGLYKRMKVKDLLVFLGELKNGKNIKSKVDRWLERLDLSDWANKKIETLSKGMSQKVQFIATIVSEPELVILDEPFTGLDPVNTEIIKDGILELQKQDATVVFSTHDMSMAEKMCDFIFMIFKGKKVLDGTLASIQDKYANDTIRVRVMDGAAVLQNLEGVEKVNDYGQLQELRVSADADPHQILKTILERTRIRSFDIVKPSLNDIFIRIAGPEAREVQHA
ncbi:ATP-binding cassette domain-containing protein [candidate division KSB1 bacterium]|nr:ATP-binding cassette domain-containing protein [candidate division KSB1 bacterium]